MTLDSTALCHHFHHPHRVGRLDEGSFDVGTGWARAERSLDVVRLQLQVRCHEVVDARFKAHGDAPVIAAGSWVCQWVVGRSLDAVAALRDGQVADALGLPPLKIHAAVLAVEAARRAAEDCRRKASAAFLP
ncbi:MAG: iron-sulfur cluster assembly scaffold protein [Candidatus Competibacterales bacterium]